MIRVLGMGVLLVASSFAAQPVATTSQTWTGWFSDKQCARVRAGEAPRPNGTPCVKKCLDEGAPAVFISEQAKAIYEVRDYPSVKNDVGYYLEVTGTVDDDAKTVSVKSVRRLAEVTSTCGLKRPAGARRPVS